MKSVLSILSVLVMLACSTKNSGKDETNSKEWKEMDSFHMIMAESFHPYKDSANLAPAKTLAKEMTDEAAKWASATLPEKVDNDEIKANIQNLNKGSQGFLKLVNENAPDSVLGKSLTDLHNLFHKIQEGWYEGEEEKHEHH